MDNLLNICCDGNFEIVNNGDEADVVISSVFGKIRHPKEKTILILNENQRPDFRICEYALSMDIDEYYGKNFYLPLWYWKIKWPGFKFNPYSFKDHPHNIDGHGSISLSSLTSKRNFDSLKDKNSFCAIIASNPEILRMNMIFFMNNYYKKIDKYGRAFGKVEKRTKSDILKNYKFCICPENSIYPGYVTEKLIETWNAGVIPIWSGVLNPRNKLINQNAFINYQNFNQMSQFIRKIKILDQMDEEYKDIYEQPLLLKKPDIKEVVDFLRMAISNITR